MKLLQSPYSTDRERLTAAFEKATSRPPAPEELATLEAALKRERQRYESEPDAARQLLAIGEAPQNTSLPATEQAAWTQLASTLLNLSETITRK